jgi:hypothetical protein
MKFDELRKLKPGDKIIVRIAEIDKRNRYWTVQLDGMGIDGWIKNEAVIAVCQKPAKIKMTVEEKKEFDKLKERYVTPYAAMSNMFKDNVPHLFKKVNTHESNEKRAQNQFKFFNAFEYPGLIEVEKPKKYYIHLFPGECGYLNKFRDTGDYELDNKDNTSDYCTAFTIEEIAKIPQDAFKIADKALEEVPEDE